MAELCPASAKGENDYHIRGREDKKILPERKPSALTVSALVRVFENLGFSARH
jgi:hypothetical protein